MVDLFQRVTSFVLAVGQFRIREYEQQHPPSPARQAWRAWRREHCGVDAGYSQSTIYLDDGLGLSILPQGAPLEGHPSFGCEPTKAMAGVEPDGSVKLSLFVNKSKAQVSK